MFRKIISLMLSLFLIVGLATSAFAANSENQLTAEKSSAQSQRTVVGYYEEEDKNEVIKELLAQNPGALIFTSVEEYNTFVENLRNPQIIENSRANMRSTRTSKHIQVNVGVTCYVNLYYDYLRTSTGTVTTVYQDSVYTSLTGYSPGVTYEEQFVDVQRTSSSHIETDWAFTLHYYLLVDGLVELGAEDVRYAFDHNTVTDTTEFTQVY